MHKHAKLLAGLRCKAITKHHLCYSWFSHVIFISCNWNHIK